MGPGEIVANQKEHDRTEEPCLKAAFQAPKVQCIFIVPHREF